MNDSTDTKTLIVYIKPGCPWCVDAEAWLKREGYSYEAVNVIANRTEYEKMQKLSGQSCAPTLTFGELMLADFDTGEMAAFFEKHGITPE
ncbi:glutaredoxin family protein [Verrucomicrobiales bacterium]|jgi:glutaredoxin 3|nr:glutaredoxin family protein [Verrucomicrobiales bacterium]|tara:strand:- start:333 stop:602 length:270 start_codon:yes stop_codon:yes gene_type:complete